jgi:hypothetical protein
MLVSKKSWKQNEKKMYDHFKNLSNFISELRRLNVQSGEISRVNQYISKIIISFDSMRSIHLYRTPVALRMFSRIFIYSFPLLYSPLPPATAGVAIDKLKRTRKIFFDM